MNFIRQNDRHKHTDKHARETETDTKAAVSRSSRNEEIVAAAHVLVSTFKF